MYGEKAPRSNIQQLLIMPAYTIKALRSNRFMILTPRGRDWFGSNDEIVIFRDSDAAKECCDGLNNPNVDYSTAQLDGIDTRDYPDFSDAFISYVETFDGIPLEDEQLEKLNEDSETVQSLVFDHIH